MIKDDLVPGVRGQLEDIRDLGFPEADADELDGILSAADAKLDEIEDDPAAAIGDENPFADVNEDLAAYGLTDCASD